MVFLESEKQELLSFVIGEKARKLWKENEKATIEEIEKALERIKSKNFLRESLANIEEELRLFYVEMQILSKSKDYTLINEFVRFFEKRFENYLKLTIAKNNYEKIVSIAKQLDLNVYYSFEDESYFCNVFDYLLFVPNIEKASIKYKHFENGKIYISKSEIVKIVSVFFQEKIKKTMESVASNDDNIIKAAESLTAKLRKAAEKELEMLKIGANKIFCFECMPECMQKIYFKIISSENVSHMERYHFAVFLANIGLDAESIVNIFAKHSSFDEKITKYHVERIIKKKYAMASCKKLKEYAIQCSNCVAKNPVQHYFKELKKRLEKNAGKQRGKIPKGKV